MARPADFMVSEVRPPVALSTQGRQTTSAPSAHAAGMYRARSVADDFERNVSMLKRGDARGPQIAQLGLTFSYPEGEHIVDLIKDGSQIQVTQANVGEFLRLLDQREIGQRHPSERVHRSNSVRQVEVFNEHPNNNYNNFSPSHFSYGLFAPFEKKSTFMVDYENSDKTLPAFLRESSKPQQQQKGLSYVDCIRYNDFVNLERIILSVKEDPNACESYGVTFCIPSKLEPQSSAEEQRSGLRSLIGGSPLQPVKRDQQAIFLALIKPYFRHLF
ncbi:hypothetical protein AGDE_03742 [Angomonas deanei]|uniref:HECT-domain (Ubiquitin-transferase), putative n=1 Tax=Angomonas deanei TaxID=59799 RepID=A0A7G2CQU2_9TRYP|nr:hypothetical protein AGDE_03742 [Angomonas deanei]CAD2221361.1 HECT-domain (ubiquitin-transferase), putative [Angomonas deanei]|eukprot:EPY40186.1 hypothetical protein AGDE_03742 [Angomonas deanei]